MPFRADGTLVEAPLPAVARCVTVSRAMRITVLTPMLSAHGALPGAWVAACGTGDSFVARITDNVTGI